MIRTEGMTVGLTRVRVLNALGAVTRTRAGRIGAGLALLVVSYALAAQMNGFKVEPPGIWRSGGRPVVVVVAPPKPPATSAPPATIDVAPVTIDPPPPSMPAPPRTRSL